MKMIFIKKLGVLWEFVLSFILMIIFSLFIGSVGGLLGGVFHKCIDYATEFRMERPGIILFLPLGSVVIVTIYKLFAQNKRVNTDLGIRSLRENKKIPLIMIPLIFVSTVITQLVGGSAGREGAALQLGGSVGYNIGRLFKLNTDKTHVLIMTGMSAVFSALFGTPITAAIFSLEVASVGLMDYTALLPCVISAITARWIASSLGIAPVFFEGVMFDAEGFYLMPRVVILSVLCAVLSIVFCVTVVNGAKLIKKALPNQYLRAIVCSTLLVAGTFLLGTYDYNGAGMEVVERAIRGDADTFSFALKILFTAVSIAAGFKGGEIVPAFFVGATFGCVVAPILGLEASLGAAIGFVALFCGVVNCPLASVILSIEVFGTSGLIFFAVSCPISYMLSGYFGLYKSQRIMYSKSDARFLENGNL